MSNKVKFDEKSNNLVPEGRQNPTEWEWWVQFVVIVFPPLLCESFEKWVNQLTYFNN